MKLDYLLLDVFTRERMRGNQLAVVLKADGLLDDQMQPIDGIALTRQIRAEPGDRHRIPIIMVCAEAGRSLIEEARDAGVNEFIKKPMSAKILEARINQTMDNPRGFVASQAYTGPDRRRHDAGERPVERRQKTAD